MESTFPMVAKTFQGLEDVLRDELIALGAQNVEIGRRMVSFEGDLEILYKANLCCRSALRILRPIFKFSAADPDELYDCVRDIEWEKYLTPESTFSIDSTVNSGEFTHSKYVTYRVKDGIVDHFTDRYGRRPSIRLKGADLMFNIHIFENQVTISLDSSGEPLSKRGYRREQTEAPINEVLAAGIILKTGWRGDTDFADPMCGSGTFLIEAALIAANINPGIYRESFAFEKWPDFNRDLFESIYNDDSEEREFIHKIYGGDIDPEAVAIARANIRNARVENMISLSCRSMGDWKELDPDGTLIMNPPYGERLRPDDMESLYRNIGKWLKEEFGGWHAWILGYRDEHFDAIHLKPSVKFPILNGSLECSLREYLLFDGKYNDFKAAGGSVANTEFEREAKRPVRHMSRREWDEESRKFGDSPRRRDDRKRDRRDDRRKDRFEGKKGGHHDDFRGNRRPEVRKVSDKGPSIDKEKAISISTVHMRSRRGWKKSSEE
ncbi:MAG: THUMP domain-containing protein [Clostridium sp.]|nr:THUMP domain-containing protein [Prevotella sp.]MCM1429592.1 THUMP domain-containing protein [Clostridium sp.]MCM1476071.1 THUMP domain-containing protein [Muribaculaceae bacterium]